MLETFFLARARGQKRTMWHLPSMRLLSQREEGAERQTQHRPFLSRPNEFFSASLFMMCEWAASSPGGHVEGYPQTVRMFLDTDSGRIDADLMTLFSNLVILEIGRASCRERVYISVSTI